MNSHFELELDTLRNIQQMELAVKQMYQAVVELNNYSATLQVYEPHTIMKMGAY